jgi:hypothetical protein
MGTAVSWKNVDDGVAVVFVEVCQCVVCGWVMVGTGGRRVRAMIEFKFQTEIE